jgi:hypothetical protein
MPKKDDKKKNKESEKSEEEEDESGSEAGSGRIDFSAFLGLYHPREEGNCSIAFIFNSIEERSNFLEEEGSEASKS